MAQPVLSEHFASRQPSSIRVAQFKFAERTDGTDAVNVAIGNVSLPMHPAMIERMDRLRAPASPFAAVNCSALPDNLLESALFGYVKGAFTDAKKDKPGRFALAEKGTLLLDEIGDLSLPMQAKLLRALQSRH